LTNWNAFIIYQRKKVYNGDGLLRLDYHVELFSEEVLDGFLGLCNPGNPSDEKNFIDLILRKT